MDMSEDSDEEVAGWGQSILPGQGLNRAKWKLTRSLALKNQLSKKKMKKRQKGTLLKIAQEWKHNELLPIKILPAGTREIHQQRPAGHGGWNESVYLSTE
jgi:hypothetical protein